jgi:hypothetical protein
MKRDYQNAGFPVMHSSGQVKTVRCSPDFKLDRGLPIQPAITPTANDCATAAIRFASDK